MKTEAQPAPHALTPPPFDVERLRRDFPILATTSHGKPLTYLDNGATTQKPKAVIDALVKFYETQNANIHRGVYGLSQTATTLYEEAREKVRAFINAPEPAEIIFVRGATEAINLVAASWGRTHLTRGDWVVVSHLEHHSDIVPWQMACAATGAELKVIPIDDHGELIQAEYEKLLASGRVRMVAVNHVSNALGIINPVRDMTLKAHAAGALILIDGAQWVAHATTDVAALDADFYAFSGHKMIGPTGVGVLFGKRKLLDAMPPYMGGGDMIESVTFEKTTYAGLPNKFEAGTPDIAGVIGLGAAIDYLSAVGLHEIAAYERQLMTYATARIKEVHGLTLLGDAPVERKAGVLSFIIDGISTLDIGVKLDKEGICVRTGHHCCQPIMDKFGISSTARASLAFYNTHAEIDRLIDSLKRISASHTPPIAKPQQSKIDYPQPSAPTITAAAEAIADELLMMEEAGGAEAKSEYVLDIAKNLPHLFDTLKQVTPRVPGCMSQVHLVAREKPTAPGTLEFVADADAEIVRGLIGLLQRLYSGQRAADILHFDIENFFSKIGLESFITSQRRNGLAGMVAKIRDAARDIAARESAQ